MAEPVTVAASFLSIRRYIETTYGPGSFRRVRDEVAATFPDFPHILAPGASYPTVWLFATLETAKSLFGPEEFFELCGRVIVDYEINVFFRFALRLTTPNWLFEKATEAWRKAHSTGVWEVAGQPGSMIARLIGFATTVNYCRLLGAYFVRLFQLSGAEAVAIDHPTCVGRGDRECTFTVKWR